MCGTCGCSTTSGAPPEPVLHAGKSPAEDGAASTPGAHAHPHDHPHEHAHPHDHPHDHEHEHRLPDGRVVRHSHHHGPSDAVVVAAPTPGAASAPAGDGATEARRIRVERDLLARNDALAQRNRQRFSERKTFVINLMSSPGSGKTTLLVRTLEALRGTVPMAVIEGDQETDLDARRIAATGVPAVQLNTGKGCHLDAEQVGRALGRLPPPERGLLFIENIGNLVCPASFDLGEAKKVVLVSVTEGEDKPLKYPDMFAVADLVLLNKVDLVPHLGFDLASLEGNVRRVNPRADCLRVSARTGEGFDAWLAWLGRGLS